MKLYESQTYKIGAYLLRHGAITPLLAQAEFGCMRLAARIAELRDQNDFSIETEIRRADSGQRYARYYLA